MQEMYQNYVEGEDWDKPQELDPFWEDDETDVMIGRAIVYLQFLAYKIEFEESVAITDHKGNELGKLQVEAFPCTKSGNEDIDDDDFIEDPEELVSPYTHILYPNKELVSPYTYPLPQQGTNQSLHISFTPTRNFPTRNLSVLILILYPNKELVSPYTYPLPQQGTCQFLYLSFTPTRNWSVLILILYPNKELIFPLLFLVAR
ncbi:predicted protein [Nematostella vectensis]|uniref:Kinesin-like KIF1-type domain-containing protein n=1 Tax=Nematostella vectensis TaxID=45351 RepID=A7T7W6_NEMVE|nr:predicted protein [Nematostella vectensis]|eukprot:XP_001620030.1 hypothetical protein NEMVEDRAFT_v1g223554 [Nematostella vectensis]